MLFAGYLPKEEDIQFIRWLYRKRHLSSNIILRASVNVADFRLERKLRYEHAKLKTRGQLRNRTRYALATPTAAGSDPVVRCTIDEKRSRSMDDPCHDFLNRKLTNQLYHQPKDQ